MPALLLPARRIYTNIPKPNTLTSLRGFWPYSALNEGARLVPLWDNCLVIVESIENPGDMNTAARSECIGRRAGCSAACPRPTPSRTASGRWSAMQVINPDGTEGQPRILAQVIRHVTDGRICEHQR